MKNNPIKSKNKMKRVMFAVVVAMVISLHSCGPSPKKIEERQRVAREQFVADSIAEVERIALEEQKRIEQQRADSIAQVEHERAVKNSIRIISYYTSSPNSAGGVDAHFRYTNLNDKVIKYLTWEAYPINAVGDAVTCSIRDYSSFRGRDTGPVKKGQSSGSGYWECAWYNYQVKKMILTGVEIEYMDGAKFRIEGDDLYLIGKKRE